DRLAAGEPRDLRAHFRGLLGRARVDDEHALVTDLHDHVAAGAEDRPDLAFDVHRANAVGGRDALGRDGRGRRLDRTRVTRLDTLREVGIHRRRARGYYPARHRVLRGELVEQLVLARQKVRHVAALGRRLLRGE